MEKTKDILSTIVRKYTMVIAMLAIWLFFQIRTDGVFLMPRNINNLFLQMCYIGICSCGMVMIMVSGNIDLSVGSVIGFTGAIIAVLLKNMNMHIVPAVLITLLVGGVVGLWQGIWVAHVGLPAFIVTLSSEMLFRGGVIGVTGEKTVQPNSAAFKAIGQGYLPQVKVGNIDLVVMGVGLACFIAFFILQLRNRKNRQKYGFKVEHPGLFAVKIGVIAGVIYLIFNVWNKDRGLPVPIIILALVVLVMHVVANHTAYGRAVYAIGGNRDAAQLSGINVKRTLVIDFTVIGVLTAISGIVYTSRLNSAAIAAGTSAETDIIAAAIIGGTSPAGGRGTIVGCIIGALVMASLENGMSILSLGSFEKYVVKGVVLLIAVALDTVTNKQAS